MRKRNCRVEVCFTKDELTVLSKKAKKAGLSIGGFVRHSVADKEIKEAPPADIPLLLRAMRQAGYNLDQTLKRFNSTNVPDMPQFRKDLEGISQKVLTDSLRSMEADGIITRTVYPEVPPRVEYALTELGKSLKPILDSMRAWGEAYKAKH